MRLVHESEYMSFGDKCLLLAIQLTFWGVVGFIGYSVWNAIFSA